MHDPMAMRPFMGYNFGHYLQHWLDFNKPPNKVGLSNDVVSTLAATSRAGFESVAGYFISNSFVVW